MAFLQEMGHNPYGLIINKVDTESDKKVWLLEGKFQGGFMGQAMKFVCKYDPLTNSTSKLEVEYDPSGQASGYA